MPRCLMPKKWKTAVANECSSWDYDNSCSRRPSSPTKNAGQQWEPPVTVLLHQHHQHQHQHHQQQHHHQAWGPSSPPAGATAPSPPPCCTGTAFHYLTGKSHFSTDNIIDVFACAKI
ncbi:Hypothetical protein CINCED_3A025379 [Cinara cedri]|uniref:Uncharacterized protein n=1 Tax=Cinara cedri TaxID=506608 RepID=A0A5E4M6U7_9HEMI|nr:Hypothetical protein CINCED_3A025379 [Cinara cedri]